MSGFDIMSMVNSVPQDPVLVGFGEMFCGKIVGIKFNKHIHFKALPKDVAASKDRTRRFFNELMNAVESLGRLPCNVFAELEFNKWLNDFEVDEFRMFAEGMVVKNKPDSVLATLHARYFDPIGNGIKTCQLTISVVLLNNSIPDCQVMYPLYERQIVLDQYKSMSA